MMGGSGRNRQTDDEWGLPSLSGSQKRTSGGAGPRGLGSAWGVGPAGSSDFVSGRGVFGIAPGRGDARRLWCHKGRSFARAASYQLLELLRLRDLMD